MAEIKQSLTTEMLLESNFWSRFVDMKLVLNETADRNNLKTKKKADVILLSASFSYCFTSRRIALKWDLKIVTNCTYSINR